MSPITKLAQSLRLVFPASLVQVRTFGEFNSLLMLKKFCSQRLGVPPYPGLLPLSVVSVSQGNLSEWSFENMRADKPNCFKLLIQLMRWARAFALASAGRSSPARMAIMAITTNSSIRVKAFDVFLRVFIILLLLSMWVTAGHCKSFVFPVSMSFVENLLAERMP